MVFLLPILHERSVEMVKECEDYLFRVVEGKRDATTATLTWDEVAFGVRRILGEELSRQKATTLLETANLRWRSVDRGVVRRAVQIYGSIPIRPRDALHAAAALESGEVEIASEDEVFDRVRGLRRVWPPR